MRRGRTADGKLLIYNDVVGVGIAGTSIGTRVGTSIGTRVGTSIGTRVGTRVGCDGDDALRYLARDSGLYASRRRGGGGGFAIRGSCVLRFDVRAGCPCACYFHCAVPCFPS